MRPPLRGVVFDVDGTLVDSKDAQARAWFDALSSCGISVSMESVRSRQGMSPDLMLRSLCGVAPEDPLAKRIIALRRELFMTRHLGRVRAIPHARRLLEKMRVDHLRLLAMGACPEVELNGLLGMAGVSDLVGRRVPWDDPAKPERPDHLLERALLAIDLPVATVLMIADTPYDVAAARRLGAPVIAIRSGGWNDRALTGAAAIYDNIGDLLRFYEASPLARNWEREVGEHPRPHAFHHRAVSA